MHVRQHRLVYIDQGFSYCITRVSKDLCPNSNHYEKCYHFRTLYCAKGNYEFGISRVIKSLEPYNKKLGTDTWYYAKRCFLSLIENMSKHMIMMRDTVIQECIQFLECCESKSNIQNLNQQTPEILGLVVQN